MERLKTGWVGKATLVGAGTCEENKIQEEDVKKIKSKVARLAALP